MKPVKSNFAGKLISAFLLAFVLAFINPVASFAALAVFIPNNVKEAITPRFMAFTPQNGVMYMSVLNPGGLQCSDIPVIIAKIDQMWLGDSLTKEQFTADVVSANALIENQTANVSALETTKDNKVKVYWVNSCNVVSEDDSDICDIGGEELTTSCEEYLITNGKKSGFTINETELFGNLLTREQLYAEGLMRAMAQLDQEINDAGIAAVNANTGRNQYTNRGYTITDTNTVVPSVAWNPTLFAYLAGAASKNRFIAPFLLSGQLLAESNYLAMMNSGNADGKGNAALFSSMKKYFDTFALDGVIGSQKAFLINRGAVAFASKTYYEGVRQFDGFQIFTVESRNLRKANGSPVVYEVWYKTRCANENIYHDFTVRAKFDWFVNPTGCSEPKKTGILSFTCA
jgi:hypothetical protein